MCPIYDLIKCNIQVTSTRGVYLDELITSRSSAAHLPVESDCTGVSGLRRVNECNTQVISPSHRPITGDDGQCDGVMTGADR